MIIYEFRKPGKVFRIEAFVNLLFFPILKLILSEISNVFYVKESEFHFLFSLIQNLSLFIDFASISKGNSIRSIDGFLKTEKLTRWIYAYTLENRKILISYMLFYLVLDNNYTHSLSKTAIHLQFKDFVNIRW